MKAIIISKNGGPEVLELKDISLEQPKADEVTIEHKAIGLNYIDTYFVKETWQWHVFFQIHLVSEFVFTE